MLFLRKLFRLPSPVELGRSKYEALPMREFTPDAEGYCWEDYFEEVKKLHPVKYWISETAADFLKYKVWFKIAHPFSVVYRWVMYNLIPKHKYHMLDLRQPGGYQYGWADVPERMLFAMFNLLKEYLDEEPYDLLTDHSIEEINEDAGMKSQHESYQEAVAIYRWWSVERLEEEKNYNDLLRSWSEAKRDKERRDSGKVDKLWEELDAADNANQNKIDEMIARLMKIRKGMWT